MERYSCLSGLTSLRAVKLTKNKVPLPKKGTISDFVKSGDQIFCELTSQDMWLEITIECEELYLLIKFEIKVSRSLLIKALSSILVDLANEVLIANNYSVRYDSSEVSVSKVFILDEEVQRSFEEIQEDSQLSEVFDYVSRHLFCLLKKQNEGQVPRRCSDSSIKNLRETPYNLPEVHPIRNLKVQVKFTRLNLQPKNRSKEIYNKSECCNCLLI